MGGSRVLVTGANGFIGTYLCNALEESGATVVRAVQEPGPHRNHEVQFDLHDPALMAAAIESAAPDSVVHLAAISSGQGVTPKDLYLTNVVGTINLLESVKRCLPNLRHFMALSSASVYGESSTAGTTEACTPIPVNDYAISKLAMEFALRRWSDSFPITVVRLFNTTGVGQAESFVIPKVVGHFARRARTLKLGNLAVRREYNDIRSVASILAALIDTTDGFSILNVCSGRGYTLREIVNRLVRMTGHNLSVEQDPALMRRKEPPILVGNNARMRSRVTAVKFHSIDATLDWLLSNGDW